MIRLFGLVWAVAGLVLGLSLATWSTGCYRPNPQPPPVQVGGSGHGGAAAGGEQSDGGFGEGGTAGSGAGAGATDASTDAPVPPGPRPIWNPADVCSSASALFDWAGCPRAGADAAGWADVCRNARANGAAFGLTKTVQACLKNPATTTKQAIVACGERCP